MAIGVKTSGYRSSPSKTWSASSPLFLCIMFICGVYIGWLIFALKHFNKLLSTQDDNSRERVLPSFTVNQQPILIKAGLRSESKGSVLTERTAEEIPIVTNFNDQSKPKESAAANHDNQSGRVRSYKELKVQVKLSNFKFNRGQAEKAVSEHATRQMNQERIKVLTAFIEQPMNDTIPGTGDQGKTEKYIGTPADYVIPLPLRKTRPDDLHKVQYPKLNSCHNLQAKLPVDEGLILDKDGNPVVRNLGQDQEIDIDLKEEAKICPVEADPWLPWIHDVFPSPNGGTIRFVAQNKRRCKTSVRFVKTLRRLEPQVALMQHVSVKRLNNGEEAKVMAPKLWSPSGDGESAVDKMPRYRLASFEESDEDGQITRFLCRFHTLEYDQETLRSRDVIIGETLSTFPVNYEFATFRKYTSSMITPRGKDNGSFWLSNFQFDCPVPDNGNLRDSIASGETVLDDGTPTIYVDIVPIRTSARFGSEEAYLPDYMTGFDKNRRKGSFYPGWLGRMNTTQDNFGFDPKSRWGDRNVLPRFEASGRWENVPVCMPAKPAENIDLPVNDKTTNKPHKLVACLWASSSFHTRGNAIKVIDTASRIREWVEFHLLSGFDHIYVYDNSGAHTNETSLAEALSVYDVSEVTRIDWPFLVCNNNIPAHKNTGERSSQYAAEHSCNRRYGPYTEWMGTFDADEYLIPMGDHNNMKDVVKKAHSKGTNILSFRSTRAFPNIHRTQDDGNMKRCGTPRSPKCRIKRANETFLETYNCDLNPLPKPGWAKRAKKQLYRPEYVPSHFVHYATITKGLIETYREATEQGKDYDIQFKDDPTEHFTDEVNDAVMLHTKSLESSDTMNYKSACKVNNTNKCRLGFPFPNNVKEEGNLSDADGYEYNCYQIEKVSHYWGPLLRSTMEKRGTRS